MNTILIDNKEVTVNNNGYVVKGNSLISYHRVIVENEIKTQENLKVITNGHVYVLNYNPQTYKSKAPKTFKEYLELKKQNSLPKSFIKRI